MHRILTTIFTASLVTLAACGGDGTDDATASSDAAPNTAAGDPATADSAADHTSSDSVTTEPVTTVGASDTVPSTNPSTAPDDAAADASPVVVEHRYGTTTIEATPERIVSLDPQWTDVLAALDTPPVGATDNPFADGWYPWQELDGVEPIETTEAIPYETVARLQPDLIVVTYQITGPDEYEQLSAIAPTIPLLGDEQVDAWEDLATVAGDVLRAPDDAARLIADAEALTAHIADELPGLDGRTYALANYVPGDQIYVVADPDDGASQLFGRLGMQIDPDLLELAGGASGRVALSPEQIGELDADLLMILTNGVDPNEIPGYDALPAVESGAVAVLDLETVSGLNTPSPLSIPYSLEFIRPALEAAAN